jgi:DNA polymerase
MIPKPKECGGCVLYGTGKGFSKPSGKLTHGVALVGEALGMEEEVGGTPFLGKAGDQLRRMISRLTDPKTGLQFDPEDFRLYNTLWCRPPDNELTGAWYEDAALAHCAPYLDKVLAAEQPRVLVALGNQALRRLTGQWGIDQLRGYYFDKPDGSIVIGTYHPSYIMRGKFELSRIFQLDLVKAVNAARGKRYHRVRKYDIHPSPLGILEWIREAEAHPERPIAFDIETPRDNESESKDSEFVALEDAASFTILRISFSMAEGHAFSIPWQQPFVDLAKRILLLPNPKVGWNSTGFDIPRLVANGCVLGGREHYDAMHMWHALEPSLPMGLKYVATVFCPDMPPWKLSASSEPEWYNAADSDVTLCCFNGIRRGLEEQGRWQMYLDHFVKVDLVLREMSSRGICVDPVKRRENKARFEARFDATVATSQQLAPLDIRRKKVYSYDEERLKRQNLWVEGAMVEVTKVIELKEGWEVGPDGFARRIPKPPKVKKVRAKPSGGTKSAKGKRAGKRSKGGVLPCAEVAPGPGEPEQQ